MKPRLQDKVALITGAASGIGRATLLRFLEEGAHVSATDISQDALDALAREIVQQGGNIETIVGDVANSDSVDEIVSQTAEHFGRIDVLVNSAGITARNVGADADMETRWDAVMRVNAKGTLLMCHAVTDVMRRHGGGSIVNMASIMGVVGYPLSLPFSDGFNPYNQSKGAVIQLTRDMGVRLAREGIRVNVVCPGFIYTPLTANVTGDEEVHATMRDAHPIGRLGEAEEVANVIAFLASDEASFVVAATIMVDGGYTAS